MADSINKAYSIVKDSLRSTFINIDMIMPKHKVTSFGYPNEFSQVLLNILNNARDVLIEKKDDSDRFVKIVLSTTNDTIKLSIYDNAGGIPEDIIDKIFDPYFTTKHASQGTGLGLYMSKMIIEQNMGGRLGAYNADIGACFEIELPINEDKGDKH